MLKKGKFYSRKSVVWGVAYSEIFLMVMMSVAMAVVIGGAEGVRGVEEDLYQKYQITKNGVGAKTIYVSIDKYGTTEKQIKAIEQTYPGYTIANNKQPIQDARGYWFTRSQMEGQSEIVGTSGTSSSGQTQGQASDDYYKLQGERGDVARTLTLSVIPTPGTSSSGQTQGQASDDYYKLQGERGDVARGSDKKVEKEKAPITPPEKDKADEKKVEEEEQKFLGLPLGKESATSHLLMGVVAAGAAFALINQFGGAFGFEDTTTKALSFAAASGIGAWQLLQAFSYKKKGSFLYKKAPMIGLVTAVVIFILMYKKHRVRVVEFTCEPWEPPIGGSNCDKCNNDMFRPCSEYRCRSLGQACQLLNAGTNEEKCAWVNPHDVNSPVITPWKEALKPSTLQYTNHDTRPPSLGTKIIDTSKSDKCLKAFTQLEFGITLNEPAQCKIDIEHTEKYDDMQFSFGGSTLHLKNHTQIFRLPAPETDENGTSNYDLILQNDGSFTYFIRCRDANGNVNEDEFAVSFCVDKSPDTTPPIIENTSILNNGYVKHGADNFTIELYLNEPAECKWSRLNKGYNEMENNMTCAEQLYQVNARMLYPCKGNLTGIKDEADNQYYFKCKDLPGMPEASRNTMTESFPLLLKGTKELNMLKKAPNETIKGSTATIKVELTAETDDGAEQGKSACFFSERDVSEDYVLMFETNDYKHKQEIYLGNGNYTYYFRCFDAGGNSVQANTTFEVYIDREMPIVTRTYKEQPDALKVVTSEDATCVYSKTSCNYEFKDGQAMIYASANIKNEHFAKWEADTIYYVKCKDEYENMPSPNDCSIVAGSSQM